MKTTIKYITALFAAGALLVSCAKNPVYEQNGVLPQEEGTRTIAVSFAPSTKTALGQDGLTPEFQLGDTIKVALKDGTVAPEDCLVDIENDIAVIHTNLNGDLFAVYPSSAANVNENQIEGVLVSRKQTGKFADANICTADIPAGSSSASFKNETAVLKFYVDKSIGVNYITIQSKEAVADGSDKIVVNVDDSNSILCEIAKNLSDERICYVAVLAGTHTALEFTSETSTQGASVHKVLQEPTTLDVGTMYNVFLPYFIDLGAEGKWGYCNVGAFLPEEPGYYFSWGNTTGYVAKNYDEDTDHVEWFLPSGVSATAGGFTNDNYSKTNGCTLTSNLTATDDAATVAWGGNWRMPTQSEFEALCKGASMGKAKFGSQFGHLLGGLFFPAVGTGNSEKLEYPNKKSSYWSSTIVNGSSYYLHLTDNNSGEVLDTESRYRGYSIRPIYGTPENPPAQLPNGALPGEFTVAFNDSTSTTTKVHFSKGNLQATYTGTDYAWGFAEHQYDYIGEASGNISIDSPNNGDVIDLFGWVGKSSSFTGAAIYGISSSENPEDYSNDVNDVLKSDWGNTIDNEGTWRTLSNDEWFYLLNSRVMPGSGALYMDATSDEDGVSLMDENKNTVVRYGIVLYPDGFTNQDSWLTTYKTWDEFANNGLVFLPSAGRRVSDDVEYYGEDCYYWTSTHHATSSSRAYYYHNLSVNDRDCHTCNSVRLVTNCATNN